MFSWRHLAPRNMDRVFDLGIQSQTVYWLLTTDNHWDQPAIRINCCLQIMLPLTALLLAFCCVNAVTVWSSQLSTILPNRARFYLFVRALPPVLLRLLREYIQTIKFKLICMGPTGKYTDLKITLNCIGSSDQLTDRIILITTQICIGPNVTPIFPKLPGQTHKPVEITG